MVISIQTTVFILMAILMLLCLRKRLRNFKGNLRPPELLMWINAIGLRPSSCVVQRATSIIFFFTLLTSFWELHGHLLYLVWSIVTTHFEKIADFEKYFSKCVYFGTISMRFEKKNISTDFNYMIVLTWCKKRYVSYVYQKQNNLSEHQCERKMPTP